MEPSIQPRGSERLIIFVLLHGKYAVHNQLLVAVREQLGTELPVHLDEDRVYTARQLCGLPFWNLLTLQEKKLAGSCIAHLVSQGVLPLVRVNEFKKYPNRYRLATHTTFDVEGGDHRQAHEHQGIST
jgi:hypothetical protein